MRKLACASGKGGTGKTTVATNLARVIAAEHAVHLLDCDVEGPNDHLFLHLENPTETTVEVPLPEVDMDLCDLCGLCSDSCAFNAISVLGQNVLVFSELCHSCGLCAYICPRGAITEHPRTLGYLLEGESDGIRFTGGELNPGEPLAPPIIGKVKETVTDADYVVIDAAPGTTCPTVEAVHGSDYCLLVTEPTPFGLSDLEMAVGMCRRLKIPFGVVINRHDLGDDRVERYCEREDIEILARFPVDLEMARTYARGDLVVDHSEKWRERFSRLLSAVRARMDGGMSS
ncbi:MAG: ATP-binding protein [Bacillota bacterium]